MTLSIRTIMGACAIGIASTAAADPSTDDAAMTCEQIAAELAPLAQQIVPTVQEFGATQQQLLQQARQNGEKHRQEQALLATMATAGALDPTGVSKRAYQAAVMAQAAKEHRENEAMLNSPLAKQEKAQGERLAAQGQQLQSNARIQHLMQLAQLNNCH